MIVNKLILCYLIECYFFVLLNHVLLFFSCYLESKTLGIYDVEKLTLKTGQCYD